MKKIICSIFAITSFIASAQTGQKWSSGGNSISTGDFLGTTNNFPLDFKTNNTLGMSLGTNGVFWIKGLSGTGSRFLQADQNGNLISFPMGNSTDVLYGNGAWGSLPAGATNWQLIGNNLLTTNTGNVGIGTNNPQYKLDVIGDAHISNNLYVGGGIVITDRVNAAESVTTTVLHADSIKMDATRAIYGTTRVEGDIDAKNKLTVTGNATFNGTLKINNLSSAGISKVYSDPLGNLFKGPFVPQSWECVPGSPNWNIGGNNVTSQSFPGIFDANIGTCDNADFILKANNNESVFIKPNGYIGFGINNNSPASAIDITDPAFPSNSHLRIYANLAGNIEASDNMTLNYGNGKNFAIGEGAPGQEVNRMNIIGGNVGIGTGNAAPTKKLSVEGDATFIANNGLNGFEVLGNSQVATRRGMSMDNDPNGDICFFINNWQSANGIPEFRFKNGIQTNGSPATTWANAPDLFVIDGLGKVTVTNYNNAVTDAFTIKNGITNNIEFKVKSNGVVYSRELNVMLGGYPDYVFAKSYKLMDLGDLEEYIKENKHLPNVPSAKEIESNGANLGELNKIQMEKIEELTLYIIELKKEVDALKKKIN